MSAERNGTAQVPRALRGTRAVVLDTDGVITDSARLHAAAWKTAFDAFLRPRGERPFDPREDYLRHVDGKSRLDGAAAFLESRDCGPPMPRSAPSPPTRSGCSPSGCAPGASTPTRARSACCAPCGPPGSRWPQPPPPGTRANSSNRREYAVSSTLWWTEEAARLGLPGKPDPALFLEATRRLGVPAEQAAVVEDALAGVEAGRRGGFGLVVGVDRARTPATRTALMEHGADLVVEDLAELLTQKED